MRNKTRPIRYGIPCMTDLPPGLGRRIIRTIMTSPPADHTKLKREAARAERRMKEIIAEIDRNEAAQKSNICQ